MESTPSVGIPSLQPLGNVNEDIIATTAKERSAIYSTAVFSLTLAIISLGGLSFSYLSAVLVITTTSLIIHSFRNVDYLRKNIYNFYNVEFCTSNCKEGCCCSGTHVFSMIVTTCAALVIELIIFVPVAATQTNFLLNQKPYTIGVYSYDPRPGNKYVVVCLIGSILIDIIQLLLMYIIFKNLMKFSRKVSLSRPPFVTSASDGIIQVPQPLMIAVPTQQNMYYPPMGVIPAPQTFLVGPGGQMMFPQPVYGMSMQQQQPTSGGYFPYAQQQLQHQQQQQQQQQYIPSQQYVMGVPNPYVTSTTTAANNSSNGYC